MMHPALYKPPTHIYRYPLTEPCGTLISIAGQEDRICDTPVLKASAMARCPVCKLRRQKLSDKKRDRKRVRR